MSKKRVYTVYEVELMRYELENMTHTDMVSERVPITSDRFDDIASMSDEEVIEEMLEEMSPEELVLWVEDQKFIRRGIDNDEDEESTVLNQIQNEICPSKFTPEQIEKLRLYSALNSRDALLDDGEDEDMADDAFCDEYGMSDAEVLEQMSELYEYDELLELIDDMKDVTVENCR